jgi:hypothetical protein
MVQLPLVAEDLLRQAGRGELTVRTRPTPELEQRLAAIERGQQRLFGGVMFAAFLISTSVLYAAGETLPSVVGLGLSGITFLRLILSKNSH